MKNIFATLELCLLASQNQCLKPGELVLMANHISPRAQWLLGIVESVKEGRDGCIRTAHVLANNKIYPRAVQNIARLEMDSMEEEFRTYCI